MLLFAVAGVHGFGVPPLSVQHDHFLGNSPWADILCQCGLHQWTDQFSRMLNSPNSVCLHCLGQLGLWSGDLLLSTWTHTKRRGYSSSSHSTSGCWCRPSLWPVTTPLEQWNSLAGTTSLYWLTLFLLSYSKILKTIITTPSTSTGTSGQCRWCKWPVGSPHSVDMWW